MTTLSVTSLIEKRPDSSSPQEDLILVSEDKGLAVISNVLALHSDFIATLSSTEFTHFHDFEGRRLPFVDVSNLLSFDALEASARWAYQLLQVPLVDGDMLRSLLDGGRALNMPILIDQLDLHLTKLETMSNPPQGNHSGLFGAGQPPPSRSSVFNEHIGAARILEVLQKLQTAVRYGLKRFEQVLLSQYFNSGFAHAMRLKTQGNGPGSKTSVAGVSSSPNGRRLLDTEAQQVTDLLMDIMLSGMGQGLGGAEGGSSRPPPASDAGPFTSDGLNVAYILLGELLVNALRLEPPQRLG